MSMLQDLFRFMTIIATTTMLVPITLAQSATQIERTLSITVITDRENVVMRDAQIRHWVRLRQERELNGQTVRIPVFPEQSAWVTATGISVTDAVVAPPGVRLKVDLLPWASISDIEFVSWAKAEADQTRARITLVTGVLREVFVLGDSGPLRQTQIRFSGKLVLEGGLHEGELDGDGLRRIQFAVAR
jgi:hypothetical protein